jgi:hypothetical protein
LVIKVKDEEVKIVTTEACINGEDWTVSAFMEVTEVFRTQDELQGNSKSMESVKLLDIITVRAWVDAGDSSTWRSRELLKRGIYLGTKSYPLSGSIVYHVIRVENRARTHQVSVIEDDLTLISIDGSLSIEEALTHVSSDVRECGLKLIEERDSNLKDKKTSDLLDQI